MAQLHHGSFIFQEYYSKSMNSDFEQKFNEWGLKHPWLKLISAQTTACYKPCKSRIFLKHFDKEHRQNHSIQQFPKRKCRFLLWHRQKWSLNIFRVLKSITSETFKNKKSCSTVFTLGCVHGWHCRGNKAESRASAGSVQISPQQQSCSWLTRIGMVAGIPGRESKAARAGDAAQPESPPPSWETGQSQHRAGCESWAG